MIEILIYVVPTVIFLGLGIFVGGWAERRHFRSIIEREASTANMVSTQSKMFIQPQAFKPPRIVCSETVIASDYFKNFLSAFRKFFGGEMKSYNSMMDRARRETLLRLKEQALADGYNAICNVRLEPADVAGSSGAIRKTAVMVSILGTATAYHSELSVVAPPSKA